MSFRHSLQILLLPLAGGILDEALLEHRLPWLQSAQDIAMALLLQYIWFENQLGLEFGPLPGGHLQFQQTDVSLELLSCQVSSDRIGHQCSRSGRAFLP